MNALGSINDLQHQVTASVPFALRLSSTRGSTEVCHERAFWLDELQIQISCESRLVRDFELT